MRSNRHSKGKARRGAPGRGKATSDLRNLRRVVGLHSAKELIKVRPKSVVEVWLKKDWFKSRDLLDIGEWAKKRKVTLKEKVEGQLAVIAESHQGVCLFTDETPEWSVEKQGPQKRQIYVALDEISDPQNLGAVLRTGWLLDVDAVFVPERRSTHLTPSAIKVASGGAEHVPVFACGNLPQHLEEMKAKGFWLLGLSGEGSSQLWRLEIPEKVIWVVGSEDKGLRKSVAKICDELVAIPQVDSAASFNASVAVALALAETQRQLQTP